MFASGGIVVGIFYMGRKRVRGTEIGFMRAGGVESLLFESLEAKDCGLWEGREREERRMRCTDEKARRENAKHNSSIPLPPPAFTTRSIQTKNNITKQTFSLTTIRLGQIGKHTTGSITRRIPHNLLYLLFTQYMILLPIMGLNDHHAHTPHP